VEDIAGKVERMEEKCQGCFRWFETESNLNRLRVNLFLRGVYKTPE
jgi:hypothetical protein